MSPFCGATDTPVQFWWLLFWISKPVWAALFALGGGIHVTCFLRFTSSATPTNLLAASMAAEPFHPSYEWYFVIKGIRLESVANLRRHSRDECHSSPPIQILLISCSVWGNLVKAYVGAPWRIGALTSGKSWIRQCEWCGHSNPTCCHWIFLNFLHCTPPFAIWYNFDTIAVTSLFRLSVYSVFSFMYSVSLSCAYLVTLYQV